MKIQSSNIRADLPESFWFRNSRIYPVEKDGGTGEEVKKIERQRDGTAQGNQLSFYII